MIWATRQYGIDDWFEVQDTFDSLWQGLGSPRDMMLIGLNETGLKKRLFVSLPDENLMEHFAGFEAIEFSDLPEAPSLEVGHQDKFQEIFRFGVS